MSRILSLPGDSPSVIDSGKIAYSIASFCAACSVGRTFVYSEIAAGRLRALKAGRRTLIDAAEARRWLATLERVSTSGALCASRGDPQS